MKIIPNVFLEVPNYNCFGCSPDNDIGLQLVCYALNDGRCVTEYAPNGDFAGFPGICHGGIAATLLDELAFWTAFHHTNTFGFTARMELKFKLPTPVNKTLYAECEVIEAKRRFVRMGCSLKIKESALETVSGNITYYLASRKDWRKITGVDVHSSISRYLIE